MKLVAFCPESFKEEYIDVFSVMVPSGLLTEKIWLEALSWKVDNMLYKFRNPEKVSEWVCRALNRVIPYDPNQLGTIVVEDNFELQEMIALSEKNEGSFPIYVTESDSEALEYVHYENLYEWVEKVAYFIGNDTYDAFCRHSKKPDEYYHLNPDKEIEPYLELIDGNLEVKCNLESNVNKGFFHSTIYDFCYYVGYEYECVRLEITLMLEDQISFNSSNELNNLINEFNSKHASKISYDRLYETYGEIRKYTPIEFYLKLDFPLSIDSKLIINTIITFYRDLHSLCSNDTFGIEVPKFVVNNCSLGFLSYLQKEISQLNALKSIHN